MATSSTSIKLRRLRQRFGIYAPRLAIRTHVAWHWRVLSAVVVVSVSLALALWIYDLAIHKAWRHTSESVDEIQSLRNHVMELDAELIKLRSLAGTGDSSLLVEKETLKQLANQVKSLESENANLREDLAFFEGLLPGVGDDNGVRIGRLRIEPFGASGEYRYRLLVVNNGVRQSKGVKENLQFLVKVVQDGKDSMITVQPEREEKPLDFYLEIKHFHRLDGVFSIPKGMKVLSIEARLLQDGVVRAKRSISL